MATSTLRVWHDGPIARVRLARETQRNALDLAMCEELNAEFQRLDSLPGIGVVIVDAAGPVFCAGADLKERKDKDADWIRRRRLKAFEAYRSIERCSKPVVALVHGAVVGSGGEIAMACDFIIAARDTTFRFPEPHWGTVGATQRLQRVIGKRRAKELLFTNRIMPVEEAYMLGLVARVVDADALERVGDEVAASIATAPGLAIRLTKQAIDLGEETDLESGIRIELTAIDQNLATADWRAGVQRFADADQRQS